ncbi:MAG: DoxX family protein [Bacteroidetes bacterium]|nr:DoxX family protein [Bacteroidota bacterium]MCL2302621.1 DoxX family protein [Lentimicrobiaceae bacterium]
MKITIAILRTFLGLTFIASAILKLFPIEAFDARIIETSPFLGWTFSMVIARLIIACELALGIFIVAGLWLRRVVYPLTLAMLGFFTCIVIYSLIRFGNEPNCGCFGELLPFSNIESLIKNIVFIAITIFLYYNAKEHSLKYWWIGIIVLGLSIFTIFMMHKIPLFLGEIELKEPFFSGYVDSENYQIEETDLYEKHLAVFLTTTCPKCKDMVRNMETLNRIYPLQNVYYFICEDSIGTTAQLFDNKEISFPYKTIPKDTFYTYLPAPYLPFIGLVDSGKYTRIWTGANFNFDRETPILKEEGIIR